MAALSATKAARLPSTSTRAHWNITSAVNAGDINPSSPRVGLLLGDSNGCGDAFVGLYDSHGNPVGGSNAVLNISNGGLVNVAGDHELGMTWNDPAHPGYGAYTSTAEPFRRPRSSTTPTRPTPM